MPVHRPHSTPSITSQISFIEGRRDFQSLGKMRGGPMSALKLWATDSSAVIYSPSGAPEKPPDVRPWHLGRFSALVSFLQGAEARRSGSVCDENSLPTLCGHPETEIFPPPAKTREESSFPNGSCSGMLGRCPSTSGWACAQAWAASVPPGGHLPGSGAHRVSQEEAEVGWEAA